MSDKKIIITTDCTCDLPDELLQKYGIDQVYFYIITNRGHFRDRDEITATNVFELMRDGVKPVSIAPPAEEYVKFFQKKLENCDEIIHITISDKVSLSYANCNKAIEMLGEDGKRIHSIDSEHLSTGTGHLVLKAVEMIYEGCSVEKTVSYIEEMREHISSSFITKDAEFLYKNNKVSKNVEKFCKALSLHPVLGMRDGNIKLIGIFRGDYAKCQMRYVKKEMRRHSRINRDLLFITHAGALVAQLENVKKYINSMEYFSRVYVTNASATVSSNCGPETIGVLFVEKF